MLNVCGIKTEYSKSIKFPDISFIFSDNDVLNAFSTALVKLFIISLDIVWISLDSLSVDNKLLDSLSLDELVELSILLFILSNS